VAKPFFPDLAFAWVFCLSLMVLTGIAAWIDTRKAIVPNRLTVLIFVLGLVTNAIRGGWLAAESRPVWWISDGGTVWLGVLDGLLFGLVGFLIIFALMFAFWIFGLCGGGDVKLMAAVAAWIGMPNFLLVWLATLVVLIFWTLGQVLLSGLSPQRVKKNLRELGKSPKDRAAEQTPPGKRGKLRTTFSFPVAVATALVLLWLFRVELQLVQPKPPADQPQGVSSHVRPPSLLT
jgi:Flp pilus assembly protein protease CpaA